MLLVLVMVQCLCMWQENIIHVYWGLGLKSLIKRYKGYDRKSFIQPFLHHSILIFDFFTGYYLIYVQLYSTSGFVDYKIELNGMDLARSRDSAPSGETSGNGQLVYKLNVGDTVQVLSVFSFELYGNPNANSYFSITLLNVA